MKRFWMSCFLYCIAGFTLSGDVIRTIDGNIYFGRVISAESGGITIESGGKQLMLNPGDILKTEKDVETLKAQSVQVTLKDGSMLTGKITDYDADIGMRLDIEFGSLTIPTDSVGKTVDPVQENIFNGFPFQAGIQGSYYLPAGDLAADFSPSIDVLGFFEANPGLFRGLFLRFEGGVRFVSYPANTNLDFTLYTLNAGIMYRVLFLRTTSIPFLNIIVPFVFAGAGVTYVALHDKRANVFPTDYGELDMDVTAQAGFDFFILNSLVFRIYAGWTMVLQSTAPLQLFQPGVAVVFSF
jgi:hypothetical protein